MFSLDKLVLALALLLCVLLLHMAHSRQGVNGHTKLALTKAVLPACLQPTCSSLTRHSSLTLQLLRRRGCSLQSLPGSSKSPHPRPGRQMMSGGRFSAPCT